MLSVRAKRMYEGLALYQPLPAVVPFHSSSAKWRLLDASNQSGKTLAGAVELARCVLDQDPYRKYPRQNGKAIVVGLDEKHLADPIWVKLGEPGAFHIIRDEHTKLWRAVRPDPENPRRLDPYDAAYREKWKDAPPLIPQRMLVGGQPTWYDKGKRIPHSLNLRNGWTVRFTGSKGKAEQGTQYRFGWIDEHIEDESHYVEMNRGFMRHAGVGVWTATAQTVNFQLTDLRERAAKGEKKILAIQLLLEDNPFISTEAKQDFFDILSEDERAVRFYGKPAIAGRLIYWMFKPQEDHGCEPFDIPDDWSRYIFLDPGRQNCGTIFVAVDPEEKHRWVYDSFILRHSDASTWAHEVKMRQGKRKYECVVCDQRAGKQTSMGRSTGDTVAHHYFQALMEEGVSLRRVGSMDGFFAASADVSAREECLIQWMAIREIGPFTGSPLLKMFRGRNKDLERQIYRAHMKLDRADKRERLESDALDCLEYAAAYNPTYYPPEPIDNSRDDKVYQAYLRRKEGRSRQLAGAVLG